MKTLLRDCTENVGSEDTSKPTTGNESFNETNSDKGIRSVNMQHQNIYLSKVQSSHVEKFINTLGILLIEAHTIRSITS
jgi:hypothetical protein